MNEGYLVPTMTVLLIMVAVYTILGGMLSVLVTDFLQFIVMSIGLLAVTYLIIGRYTWGAIIQTVEQNHGAAGYNPFPANGSGISLGTGVRPNCGDIDVANDDCPSAGGEGYLDGTQGLYRDELFLRLPFPDSRNLGNHRVDDFGTDDVVLFAQAPAGQDESGWNRHGHQGVRVTKDQLELSRYDAAKLKKMKVSNLPEEVKSKVNVKEISGSRSRICR